jgi:hypothetical protein
MRTCICCLNFESKFRFVIASWFVPTGGPTPVD